ncbi:DUF1186 domain-containing protein [Brunnivagina elsteri]|uniref:DUF1186 domain-containing protein n=1 Tax=Brunnivagina elsteri CCALA 953 TaxID=987040 RepID=A0A2A2TEP9_9CYAN|nr:DUF1186 domain-containing protein [Calothrix elsteri]PAX52126.1 hypothetical protein CK510_20955 [Calothrix elsteri CCALA 953]
MQLTEIISQLENNTGTFPREALERAIEEKSAITPLLLATLEECKNNLENLLEESEYTLHLYAFYLLAQFREKSAYPLIVEFFSVPGEIAMDATGDLVTEDLGRIIASVFDGNLDPIKQIIENQQANEYIRSAFLSSLVVLVVQGIISREQVIQYFEELFSTKLERKPDYIFTRLVVNSCKLCFIELKKYIDEVFEEGLIESFFISQDNVNDSFQGGVEIALTELREKSRYSLIENTISEIESWICFRQDKLKANSPISPGLENFAKPSKSTKAQASKKREMQKQARRKNRPKKK